MTGNVCLFEMVHGRKSNKSFISRWLVAAILILSATWTHAQPTGENLSVALVTMGPGQAYWERFGHNAILIENTKTRVAALYNYGVFDFRQDSFLLNFLRGRMQYQLMPFDPKLDFQRYLSSDRDVRIQYLDLLPSQRLKLAQFLDWNARPENAPYRYDYFRNNCSTRIRDALDESLEGALLAATQAEPAIASYRFHAERQSAPILPLYLGVRLALGREADSSISRWDELFMPAQLHDAIASLSIETPSGEIKPLVERTWHLHDSQRHEGPAQPPYRPLASLGSGALAALTLHWLLLGSPASLRRRIGVGARHFWVGTAGLSGLFLCWLAFGSEHYAAHYNENLLVLSPLMLLFWFRWKARWSAGVLLFSFALALILKGLPGSQQNVTVLLGLLPLNLVVLWHHWAKPDPSFGT